MSIRHAMSLFSRCRPSLAASPCREPHLATRSRRHSSCSPRGSEHKQEPRPSSELIATSRSSRQWTSHHVPHTSGRAVSRPVADAAQPPHVAFAQSAASPSVPFPNSAWRAPLHRASARPPRRRDAGSVTVPSVAQQRAAVTRTVGSVAFVDAEDFQDRYANTLRDVLRTSPASTCRSVTGRSCASPSAVPASPAASTWCIEVLQDGIPFNLADGSGDFYQIDPLATAFGRGLQGAATR